jgi:hypothetical protein
VKLPEPVPELLVTAEIHAGWPLTCQEHRGPVTNANCRSPPAAEIVVVVGVTVSMQGGGATPPVPDSVTVGAVPVTLVFNDTVALKLPNASGANPTYIVQLAPGARAAPHRVRSSLNCAESPVREAPSTVCETAFGFVMVIICRGAFLPTAKLPKSKDAGETVNAAAVIMPLPETGIV